LYKLTRKLSEVRKNGKLNYLRPDGKSQVSVEYVNGKPKKVTAVVIAAHHSEAVPMEVLRADIKKLVIEPVLGKLLSKDTEIFINSTGKFVIGGPPADAGTGGQKVTIAGSAAKVGSNQDGGNVDLLPGDKDGIGNPGIVNIKNASEYTDGQKQIVDLVSGEVTVVNLSEKYVFAGDKWFYYDGNLLAAFDRKFSRVLWAKYLEKGLMVDSLQYFASSSRNFLNIGLGASPIIASSGGGLDDADRANESGRLYELKGNQLELLLREKIDNLQLDSSGHLYFLKNGTEIWKWQSDLKLPRLLGRFQNGVRLVSTAIKLFKTSGVLVIESGQKLFLKKKNHAVHIVKLR
jgi:hypothetical protein